MHGSRNTITSPHMRIDIVNIPAIKVAALEHHAAPDQLQQSIDIFNSWRKESGYSPVATKRSFGMRYSNPEVMPIQDFHFAICGEVDVDIPENEQGICNQEIPAGRYAKLRHVGSPDTLQLKVDALCRAWLPSSDECQRDNSPLFFEYLNYLPEVPENEYITDIYLPLK